MSQGQETNWVVITGAPSSGKTSVIDELARRGYAIQNEVARELIEDSLKHGLTVEQARADTQELQHTILTRKTAREAALDPQTLVFLDRGLPDSIAYFQLAGMDDRDVIAAAKKFHYRAVFIFDPLPVVKDGVRLENQKTAEELGQVLEKDYIAIGYAPVHVPLMPVAARADFILKRLGV